MGISQALYTGVTGLAVNSDGMAVIANNIANANAKGFKRDRAEFEDLLSVDLNSANGPAQIGRGSRLRDVKTIFSQGSLKVTDSLTDLAIQGNGFFVVQNDGAEVRESSGRYYTRVGSLQFDKDGFLSDGQGGKIQGYVADASGDLTSRLADVRIQTANLPPKATDVVNFNLQLDSRSPLLKDKEFDITSPIKSSNYNTSITVYDSQGTAHNVTVFFRKMSTDNETGTNWEWRAVADSKDLKNPSGNDLTEIGKGEVEFDKNGFLSAEKPIDFSVTWNNGSIANQSINFDFGVNNTVEQGNGINASTSIAAESSTIFHQQSGYEAGNLQSLEITQSGTVEGLYTNGLRRKLAGVALATFENKDALQKGGRNLFTSTVKSGPAKIGLPQSGGRGSLFASSLEESNVDLASEFVDMILTQRLFQANSRSITTTDTMIEEVVNLKR